MNSYFILIIVIGLAGIIVQSRMQSVFKKYSREPFAGGMTGREVAEKMLYDNGINDVKVVPARGSLTDFYDPRKRTVNLSEAVYNSNSVAAAAVAAHECGHAVQHAFGYAPLSLRSSLVPFITLTSSWAVWVVIVGLMLINTFPAIFWVGIAMIALSAIFSVITLPVEYNASSRALAWLDRSGMLNQTQMEGAKEALQWAARTYLVAAISAIAVLLYYVGLGSRRN